MKDKRDYVKSVNHKILSGILLATIMLCTSCGNNGAGSDTVSQNDTEQLTEEQSEDTNFQEKEVESEEAVGESEEYIQEPSGQVSDEESYETVNESEEQSKLFTDFINNGGKAKVAENFRHDNVMIEKICQAGEELDLVSLLDCLQQNEVLSGAEPKMEYAKLNNPKRMAYALSICYETDTENWIQFFILSEKDAQLEINYAIDGWSRRYPYINENGVIFDSGSNGAASYKSTTYVPDSEFEYKVLSASTENGYGFSFYDADGEPVETVNDIVTEAGEGNQDAMNVLYSQVVIDEKTYYYYLGMDGITQELVDYIDGIAKEHGFTFDGKDAVTEAERAYAEKLGVGDIYDNEKMAEWAEVSELY